MTILLFGVTNVGKSTVGEKLADKLGFAFYDLDDEVKRRFHITLEEFVKIGTVEDRDIIRGEIINEWTNDDTNKVAAITPMSNRYCFENVLNNDSVIAIELRDTNENIFDRLVFSDENDNIYKDDEYKYAHMDYYLRDIQADLDWYGFVYSIIDNKYDMNNESPDEVVDGIIKKFRLA